MVTMLSAIALLTVLQTPVDRVPLEGNRCSTI
jgi:hypothetical protein